MLIGKHRSFVTSSYINKNSVYIIYQPLLRQLELIAAIYMLKDSVMMSCIRILKFN